MMRLLNICAKLKVISAKNETRMDSRNGIIKLAEVKNILMKIPAAHLSN